MFRILSDIHLDSGSVRIIPITRNTTKQDPFGIYVGFGSVQIHFYRIGFGLGFWVRFICPALYFSIEKIKSARMCGSRSSRNLIWFLIFITETNRIVLISIIFRLKFS